MFYQIASPHKVLRQIEVKEGVLMMHVFFCLLFLMSCSTTPEDTSLKLFYIIDGSPDLIEAEISFYKNGKTLLDGQHAINFPWIHYTEVVAGDSVRLSVIGKNTTTDINSSSPDDFTIRFVFGDHVRFRHNSEFVMGAHGVGPTRTEKLDPKTEKACEISLTITEEMIEKYK